MQFDEIIAYTLYGLSKVHLACKPTTTTCIAEFITCGYCMDHNGFPRFPLYKLAEEKKTNEKNNGRQ